MVKRCRMLLMLILACMLAGCASVHIGKPGIRIAGSDTMLPLNRVLAASYMRQRPGLSIICEGGGTSAGMQALLEGKADICAASRPIAPEEVSALAGRYHSIGMAHFVCKDALEIYLHPQNPVESLQTAQVKAIFSGKIRNWRQVGGADRPIHVYIRSVSSGTRRYFAEHLLQDVTYCKEAIEVDTNSEMARLVTNDPAAIGYGGNAYRTGVKICKLDGIAPTRDRAIESAYPLSRYLYFYTVEATHGRIKEFIDWVISPDVQMLIQVSGYYPIWRH
jgi:phosphate transport system substrate-binding protein